jgi:transposase
MRVAAPVVLTGEQRSQLQAYSRGRKTPARLVVRARIVLLAAEGKPDVEIARLLSLVPRSAARWRARFLRYGIAGLQQDAPRAGRPRTVPAETVAQVIRKTTQEKPSQATHWSTRSMAAATGVSEASVRRIWRAHGLNRIACTASNSATIRTSPSNCRTLSACI